MRPNKQKISARGLGDLRACLNPLVLMIAAVALFGVTGCSSALLGQADSLRGIETDRLRDWARNDPTRDKLVVFVHGFNSSKDGAWGAFPDLVKEDNHFKDFNIHRFGYPTKLCGQVSDIRNLGDHLASILLSIFKNPQQKYRQVVLVGHSMGGLVILEALMKLERDNLQLLKDQDLKVLTFGTPYYGVENAGILELFCENKQAKNMTVLNDKLGELSRDWTQRFNQKATPGGRDAPYIPLYAFHGTEDRFVTKVSACGYPQTPCESVDGDHISMVKPANREQLAYQKLRELAVQPRVPPTTEGKIGIWVARLTGDDASHAAQRHVARQLEFYITREDPQLQRLIDVRELQVDVTGYTPEEKEAKAKSLGQDHQASIVVWGDLTGPVLHPRITLVNPLPTRTKTAVLPETEAYQISQLSAPPGNVRTPPQSVNEPLQLARFLTALTFLEREDWTRAAHHLDQFIEEGLAQVLVRTADVYYYTAWTHHKLSVASGQLESLKKARDRWEMALKGYKNDADWMRYASTENSLGMVYSQLASYGFDSKTNFSMSVTALTEAARLAKEQHDEGTYLMTQINLGLTYVKLAEYGVNPAANLAAGLTALTEAARLAKEQHDEAYYLGSQINLGLAYLRLAEYGVNPPVNLAASVTALTEAARLAKEQHNAGTYLITQINLGLAYLRLAEYGVNPPANLAASLTALTEAARLAKEQHNAAYYLASQINLGLAYLRLAENGVNPPANLAASVTASTEAARLAKEQHNEANYLLTQINLGLAYVRLAEYEVNPPVNLAASVTASTEAARLAKEQHNEAYYLGSQINLGLAYLRLAENGVNPPANLAASVTALTEAARLAKEHHNDANYLLTQINLGLAYVRLAENGVNPPVNLAASVTALTEAARLAKEHHNDANYLLTQINLGLAYMRLAEYEVNPPANLAASVTALTEAARLAKEQHNEANYLLTQINLGLAYVRLAEYEVNPPVNLAASVTASTEAARLAKEQHNEAYYLGSQINLGLAYMKLAENEVDTPANLAASLTALTEAVRLAKATRDDANYIGIQMVLGVVYMRFAEYEVTPTASLAASVAALRETVRLSKDHHIPQDLVKSLFGIGRSYEAHAVGSNHDRKYLELAKAAYTETRNMARHIRDQGLESLATTRLKIVKKALDSQKMNIKAKSARSSYPQEGR